MLSPLLNAKSFFSAGSFSEASEPSSNPREPGDFSRLLSACLKNPDASGEGAEVPSDPLASGGFARLLTSCLKNPAATREAASLLSGTKKSSSEQYSSIALLSLLQKSGTNSGRDPADALSAEGLSCPPEEEAIPVPLSGIEE